MPTDALGQHGHPGLTLELKRDPEAPSLARAAIVGFCEARELSPATIATVTLLVSEVVTNAVVHPDAEPPGAVALNAYADPGTIRVEVSDQGGGFTPRLHDPSRLEGGYGLYLVDKEATRWGVEAAPKTTVWFEVATAGG
ncbi:MAG: ATP-binding protein [Solirubrobacteraceae bacterium]